MPTLKARILAPISYLTRKIVEFNIKSALKDNDPAKARLRLWLKLANSQTKGAEYWKYTFSDGRSLAETAIQLSNEALARYKKKHKKGDLHAAQSYYKGLLLAVNAKNQNRSLKVDYKWYHRLLGWFKKQSGLVWQFNSTDLNTESVFNRLKESEDFTGYAKPQERANAPTTGITLPSIREKYSPEQLLNKPTLLLNRMKKATQTTTTAKKPTDNKSDGPVAPHLKPWVTSLTLHNQIDISQQQQQNMQQQQQIQVNAEVDLRNTNETSVWLDNSDALASTQISAELTELNYKTTVDWIQQLLWKCKRKADSYQDSVLLISQKAADMLKMGRGIIRADTGSFDFDILPLGFFIDKDEENKTFTLKYNDKYRQHQLDTLTDATLRLDVYRVTSDTVSDGTTKTVRVSKNDLLNTFKLHGITLDKKRLTVINSIETDNHIFKFGNDESSSSPMSAYIFRALQLMVTDVYQKVNTAGTLDRKNDNYIYEIIDIIETLIKVKISFSWGNQDARLDTPLAFFTRYYLCHITDGKEFYSASQRKALWRFANLKNNEISLYYNIVFSGSANCNFAETSSGMFYFFDYFNSLGVDIPNGFLASERSSVGGFVYLKHMLDFISLAGGKTSIPAQRIQAKLIDQIPHQYHRLKTCLRSGYSFVHESMLLHKFDEFGSTHELSSDPITKDDFEKMSYGEPYASEITKPFYFRAMYLRYIAYYVNPNYLKVAIDKWVELTKSPLKCGSNYLMNGVSYELIIDNALLSHWNELKTFALSLPAKMDIHADSNVTYTAEGYANLQARPNEKIYEDSDINELFAKLNLSDELSSKIQKSLTTINTCLSKYNQMKQTDLETALKTIRKLNLEERIALLREVNYRITFSKSSSVPPEGELLRLEQVVAVLIAMNTNSLLEIDTGEGKTLIIQFVAILKALNKSKIDIITHNETLATEAADKMAYIARYLNLKIAKKDSSSKNIIKADIFCCDISTAILNKKMAQFSDNPNLPGRRVADVALGDEIDNVGVDINAYTTMQISENSDAAEDDLIKFISTLNNIVRNQLSLNQSIVDKAEQRKFIMNRLSKSLKDNPYYLKCKNAAYLDSWIKAAVSAMQQVKKVDYVVENDDIHIKSDDGEVTIPRKVVRIVHKETTGRVDKKSQWGEYIHQCIAVWEMQYYKDMHVPGLSQILAEGDVAIYFKEQYKSYCAFTATAGEPQVREYILSLLGENAIYVAMPRAKRPLKNNANWPLVPMPKTDSENEEVTMTHVYNRSYRFMPMYLPTRQTHADTILTGIHNIQADGMSCIVFLNTITQCDQFFAFLARNNIDTSKVQILDDTRDDESASNQRSLRPAEATILQFAKTPGMITLSTAAGGRGLNFDDINVAFITYPGLRRFINQEAGRVGRNAQFGLVYEIYCLEDLQLEFNSACPSPISFFGDRQQKRDIDLIHSRAESRQAKAKIQSMYLQLRANHPDKQQLDKAWAGFFTHFKSSNDKDLQRQWQRFSKGVKI